MRMNITYNLTLSILFNSVRYLFRYTVQSVIYFSFYVTAENQNCNIIVYYKLLILVYSSVLDWKIIFKTERSKR